MLGTARGREEVLFCLVRVFGTTRQISNDGTRSPKKLPPSKHAASRYSTRDDLKTDFPSGRRGRVASYPYQLKLDSSLPCGGKRSG